MRRFSYRCSSFHRIISGFLCEGDELTRHKGCDSKSIGREIFEDKNFILRQPPVLSTIKEQTQKRSQFLICTDDTEWLENKPVVFGRVRCGVITVNAVESFGSRNGKTGKKMVIAECRQLGGITSAI